MFPPARCFRMKKSPMSLLLGSEIENDSGDRLRITHVTFVGSAYTARTHFTSRPSSFAMLVSARGILEIRCDMWRCLILNAVVVTGPACSPRPARSSVQSRDVDYLLVGCGMGREEQRWLVVAFKLMACFSLEGGSISRGYYSIVWNDLRPGLSC